LAHLSPTKLREAISDIWSQEVKADVPIPQVDNGSADNELSTTEEGTPPLSTTEEGTVIHEPLGGGPAVIHEAMATDQDDELSTMDNGMADHTIAPAQAPPR
jgi:hypothetical protein